MGRPSSDFRGARRNALRGGFYRDAEGRKLYRPSRWPEKAREAKQSVVSRKLYANLRRAWDRFGHGKARLHQNLRQIGRQWRNNPTCRMTVAELDARTAALEAGE